MRPMEREIRKMLKHGLSPETIRDELLYAKEGTSSKVSHWAGNRNLCFDNKGNTFCGCRKILYYSETKIHFTEVNCKRARVALCLDKYTGELTKHPILACPDTQYFRKE